MIELIIPSRMGYERLAMDCSASLARMLGFIQERIEDLRTAVAEACLNAMEHGNRGLDDSRVIIRMNCEGDSLVVSVIDQGKGINRVLEEPSIEKMIENRQPMRGFGVFMIRNLVDQVDFVTDEKQRHTVRMVFRKSH